MLKKIFKPIGATGATLIVSFASLISYVIGLLRDRIIATNFGTTIETDTYNASFLIPDLLFNMFIAGALAAAFLPVFTDYLSKNKEEAYKIANSLITWGTLAIGVLAGLAFLLMPQIIPNIFGDISIEQQEQITNMTKIILPTAILFTISNSLGNILMSYKHFLAYAISPVLYNLGIILGVIFLNESMGIYSAAIGVLAGAILHLIVRIIDICFTDYNYKPSLSIKKGFRKILKLMIPRSISLVAWQLNLYIFAIVSMKIIDGGLAAFNFARNIQSIAVNLFGIAFATAIFPYIVSAASQNDKESYTQNIQKTIHRILYFTIPSTLGIYLLSKEIISLILGGGMFDEKSILLTSTILVFFTISIPFESLSHILSRAFYAKKNTMTPMLINVFSMATMATLSLTLAPKYGIGWLSISFSIGFIIQIVLLSTFLKKHLSGFSIKTLSTRIIKIILASCLMGAIIILTKDLENLINNNISHIIRISLGAGTYFFASYLLKIPEIKSVAILFQKFKKAPVKVDKSLKSPERDNPF
ncbi:murein biosynthesis integral membrane protein MurJ [Patescibacteria group bacterium]|nr:murein biosynthesis integral membrane protein MurJ [Patescibacteria group bacterium]